jgi:hypothetical protein
MSNPEAEIYQPSAFIKLLERFGLRERTHHAFVCEQQDDAELCTTHSDANAAGVGGRLILQ